MCGLVWVGCVGGWACVWCVGVCFAFCFVRLFFVIVFLLFSLFVSVLFCFLVGFLFLTFRVFRLSLCLITRCLYKQCKISGVSKTFRFHRSYIFYSLVDYNDLLVSPPPPSSQAPLCYFSLPLPSPSYPAIICHFCHPPPPPPNTHLPKLR